MKLALAFVAGLLLAPVAALASHVSEPTAPIVDLQVRVYNYASQTFTDCEGSPLAPKVRLQPIVTGSALPSEHFAVTMQIDERRTDAKGQTVWRLEEQYAWSHQNIGPHNASLRFQAAYSSFGVTSSFLDDGYYRLVTGVWGDESGAAFVRTCEFTIEG